MWVRWRPIVMALAVAAISGCSASQPTPLTWTSDLSKGPYLTPAGTPLTWTSDLSSKGPFVASPSPRSDQEVVAAGIAAEAATLAATGATHQLLATGFGTGPEDRAAIYRNQSAIERDIALANDAEGQAALAALGKQEKVEWRAARMHVFRGQDRPCALCAKVGRLPGSR